MPCVMPVSNNVDLTPIKGQIAVMFELILHQFAAWRTPLLQIGADIYCDTALICKVLEALQPSPNLDPPHNRGPHGKGRGNFLPFR